MCSNVCIQCDIKYIFFHFPQKWLNVVEETQYSLYHCFVLSRLIEQNGSKYSLTIAGCCISSRIQLWNCVHPVFRIQSKMVCRLCLIKGFQTIKRSLSFQKLISTQFVIAIFYERCHLGMVHTLFPQTLNSAILLWSFTNNTFTIMTLSCECFLHTFGKLVLSGEQL